MMFKEGIIVRMSYFQYFLWDVSWKMKNGQIHSNNSSAFVGLALRGLIYDSNTLKQFSFAIEEADF